MKGVIIVVALLVACCTAQLSSTDQATLVSLHNNARATAIPTPQTALAPISWDPAIAADAQRWASNCTQNYSPKFYLNVYGENPLITNRLDVTFAFNTWLNQKTNFNFDTGACSAGTCMNFQQIVSSATTVFGCGAATCSFGTFIVCDYKTFAQKAGTRPYVPTPGAATPAPATPAPPVSSSGGSAYPSIDYRGTKLVLGVHDQKQCGSCWAFSSAAIIEGALGKRGITSPLLSDQCVLDCSGGGTCNGGWTRTALQGMISKGGINSQAEYPYTQVSGGACKYNAATSIGKITATGQTTGTFEAIYAALRDNGPVGIAVFADDSWYRYGTGVVAADYTEVNHAVTVVGFDSAKDAWIVKNSWGGTWGAQGYIYLSTKRPYGANRHGAFWAK